MKLNELRETVQEANLKVETGTRKYLLPNLTSALQNPEWIEQANGISDMYHVSNALSMMLRRMSNFRDQCEEGEFTISTDGNVYCRGEEVISPRTLFQELHISTGLPPSIMSDVVEWAVNCGRTYSHFFIDTTSEALKVNSVEVKLEDLSGIDELYEWWKGGADES